MAFSIPDDLRSAFKENKCGIFVGAGISQPAGLPDWSGMLKELIGCVRQLPNPEPQLMRDLNRLLKDKSKQLTLASVLKEELGQDFFKYVEERFAATNLNPTAAHKAIVALPARFLITTNYDRLLERAILEMTAGRGDAPNTYTYKQAGTIASCLHRDRFFILKAHGDAKEDPEGIILTEKDYRQVIHHEPGYQSLLQTLFTTFTILFVGTSFTDIELQLLLGYIHSSFHGKTPIHYALIAEETPNAALVRAWRKDFNIHVIHVSPKQDYKQVLEFLVALKIKVA
jgi:hypothetical protein